MENSLSQFPKQKFLKIFLILQKKGVVSKVRGVAITFIVNPGMPFVNAFQIKESVPYRHTLIIK